MGNSKSNAAIAADGWNLNSDYVPQPRPCKECGDEVPRTRKRSDAAYGGHGRPREFCSAACRQRHSRRTRAAKFGAELAATYLSRGTSVGGRAKPKKSKRSRRK